MKDDSLNDTQQDNMRAIADKKMLDTGYCPMCDTVYDKPHECVGKQKYHPVSALDTNVYERQIWNDAIEAAAELFPYGEWEEINIAAKIRKLKK